MEGPDPGAEMRGTRKDAERNAEHTTRSWHPHGLPEHLLRPARRSGCSGQRREQRCPLVTQTSLQPPIVRTKKPPKLEAGPRSI